MTGPNAGQQELIDGTEGCYLVDAGPGTGKTFTITRRYAEIVAQDDVEPDDVLLITFTRNAATEMRDRIVSHCEYGTRELRDAPIGTFHSLCNDILREHGFDAPSHLGLEDAITQSTTVLENETIEGEYFLEFVRQFTDDHPEYHDLLRVVDDPSTLLDLINNLAARGVFPMLEGWYRDSDAVLEGDRAAFETLFEAQNEPRNEGNKQSRLRESLGKYGKDSCYLPEAPEKGEIRGQRGSKSVPDHVKSLAFDEDRAELTAFVHDIYFEYLSFALSRNYLNFGFLQLFAFVHLCENEELRDRLAYDYVMIDEFQDTSEIQFKLALLLAGTENVCVVGDWKQSIYSFQYAAVENITQFEDRLERFVAELNADQHRIEQSFNTIESITLEKNYRSTQPIIDCSEEALTVQATKSESVGVDLDAVTKLDTDTDHTHSQIDAVHHEDEHAAILTKIEEIVGNEAYAVRDQAAAGEDLRTPTYGDIAILTRTRDFGRELLSLAGQYDFPMAYEGGVELFRSDPAKLLLAWLRILEGGSEEPRGWAVVLEQAGYTLAEIDQLLETEAWPSNLVGYRDQLAALETVSAISHRVSDTYGYDGPTAEVLRTTIQSIHDGTTMTRGELIRFIERGIDAGTTHDISAAAGTDAITVQTIHAAKGLEYPIVIMANMNRHKFPSTGGNSGRIVFDERFGLRQRKVFDDTFAEPHSYDNWRWDILSACRPTEYDEERRLLYVAMTRAEDHLVFTAGQKPNSFLEHLSPEIEPYQPAVQVQDGHESVQTQFEVPIPEPSGPRGYSPHSLMTDDVFEDVDEGRGTEYGSKVHDFAERYALGEAIDPRNADEERVAGLLESRPGDFRVEEDVHLPLEVDGEDVIVRGVVDLVHLTTDTVESIDYKTDLGRHGTEEYRVQLSIYWHVLESVYPDREVTANLFFTAENELVEVDPLSKETLRSRISELES